MDYLLRKLGDCEWTKEEVMSWFKRHLNWTLFLVVCALQMVGYPTLTFFAGGEGIWDFWVAFAIGILIYYGVYDYVLSEKGKKSHDSIMGFGWFLLWLTGWVGVIILLLAKNKNQVTE